MNRPEEYHLTSYAPLRVWKEAIKQAERSDHKRHRTGAVIFRDDDILAKGCSHTHDGGMKIRSIHAEMEALRNFYSYPYPFPDICVVTLTKNGNFATISKPCTGCAHILLPRVRKVIFAERNNVNAWAILSLLPDQLVLSELSKTRYVAEPSAVFCP